MASRIRILVLASLALLVAVGCRGQDSVNHWVVEITNSTPVDYVAVVTTNRDSHRWLIASAADSRDLVDSATTPESAELLLLDAGTCALAYQGSLPTESVSISLDPGFGNVVDLRVNVSVKRSLVAGELLTETTTCAGAETPGPS